MDTVFYYSKDLSEDQILYYILKFTEPKYSFLCSTYPNSKAYRFKK